MPGRILATAEGKYLSYTMIMPGYAHYVGEVYDDPETVGHQSQKSAVLACCDTNDFLTDIYIIPNPDNLNPEENAAHLGELYDQRETGELIASINDGESFPAEIKNPAGELFSMFFSHHVYCSPDTRVAII